MIERTPKQRDNGLLPLKCWYCGVRFQEGELRNVTVLDNGLQRLHRECFKRYMNSEERRERERRR